MLHIYMHTLTTKRTLLFFNFEIRDEKGDIGRELISSRFSSSLSREECFLRTYARFINVI